ncbi:hypothetical protein SBA6_40037 [Candidatus Sulfopaludibacter sp. SbA6]|nr:hypothetical protein SBA6_40037 [Candidatus Sulfopaludibacter sp. SbA6]
MFRWIPQREEDFIAMVHAVVTDAHTLTQ